MNLETKFLSLSEREWHWKKRNTWCLMRWCLQAPFFGSLNNQKTSSNRTSCWEVQLADFQWSGKLKSLRNLTSKNKFLSWSSLFKLTFRSSVVKSINIYDSFLCYQVRWLHLFHSNGFSVKTVARTRLAVGGWSESLIESFFFFPLNDLWHSFDGSFLHICNECFPVVEPWLWIFTARSLTHQE